MPVIDTYTIFGSWPGGGADLSLDRLKQALSGKNIVAAVTHSTQSVFETCEAANTRAASDIADIRGLYAAAVVDPTMSVKPWEMAARAAAANFVCIRFFPEVHKWPIAGYLPFQKCLEAIEGSGVPVSVAITSPGQISALAAIGAAREMKVILAHVAEDCISEVAAVLPGLAGWYISTDGLVRAGLLEELAGAIGHERIIFGSTAPRGSVAGALNYVRLSHLPDEAKEAIFYGNAASLFGGRFGAN